MVIDMIEVLESEVEGGETCGARLETRVNEPCIREF